MGLLAVIAAAVAAYVFGAVWYIALSRPWLVATGLPLDETGKPVQGGSPLPFLIGFVMTVIVAGMMRHVLAMSGLSGIGPGALAGLGIGAFLITPWVIINYSFSARKPMLSVIDGANSIVGPTIIGAVLGYFAAS